MKVFIWTRVEEATQNYHSEGGVVVFADTEVRARALASAERACIAEDEHPEVRDASGPEAVYIFPDAGCC